MANAFYTDFFDQIGQATTNLLTADIRVILVDTATYTFSAAHDFLDDIPAVERVATAALATKTLVDGVYDAADTVLTSVTGDQSEALVLYNHTPATDATRNLICYLDSYSGLPITPNGQNITIVWPTAGILSLA